MSYALSPQHPKEMFFNFTYSDMFKKIHNEGISLVHETITYLEEGGKTDSHTLSDEDSWTYSIESMNLTTRLMQIASWLMLQRSVVENKIDFEEAYQSKYRLLPKRAVESKQNLKNLPRLFLGLVEKTEALLIRIQRLDKALYENVDNSQNEALRQLEHLKSAFLKT